jgi:hypothetical protein
MDPQRFDNLAKTVSGSGTRRGFIRLLAVLPLGVTPSSLLHDVPDAVAKNDDHGSSHRRHRRKARHHHQTGKDKDRPADKTKSKAKDRGKKYGHGKSKDQRSGRHRQSDAPLKEGCTPESVAQTCAGTCSEVRNNCGTKVDCGSCACGGCQICQFCDAGTGQCVPNESVAGQICGAARVCQAGGSCVCDPVACADTGPGMSCVGGPTPGVCGCTPESDSETCPGQCGEVRNNCGTPVDCGACTCDPICEECQSCDTTTGQCENQGGICCQSDAGRCQAGMCQPCAAGEVCVGGTCKVCVCDDGSACYPTIQDALAAAGPGATIEICAGTYDENVKIRRDVTLIGAGDGANPARNTIIRGTGSDSVVEIISDTDPDLPTVMLQGLRVTGGSAFNGGGIRKDFGTLTMTDCTVTGNTASESGGGIFMFDGALSMSFCTVSANSVTAPGDFKRGGGIDNHQGNVTLKSCIISGNSTAGIGGGICNDPGNHPCGTVTLEDTEVVGNSAGTEGGGIFSGEFCGVELFIGSNSVRRNTPDNCAGHAGNFIAQPGVCAAS